MADSILTQDTIFQKLSQLGAMLAMTHGGGLEAFEGLTSAARDNYMSACAGIVDDCITMVNRGDSK